MPPHLHKTISLSYDNKAFQADEIIEGKATFRRAISYQPYLSLVEEAIDDHPVSAPPTSKYVSIVLPEPEICQTQAKVQTGSQRLRWNLVFNILVWIICPLPIWLPFATNQVAIYVIISIQACFGLIWLTISLLAAKNAFILYRSRNRDYSFLLSTESRHKIRHIVAISCYKEPLDLIKRSVDTVAAQTEVNRVSMVISFEERTPDVHHKCDLLREHYANAGFHDLIFTIHPYGLPNEIPGKCSNANYALRTATKELNLTDNSLDEQILVTTCDADSQFHPQYIAALTYQYVQDKCPANGVIYQPPLFYNWNLDGSAFFTRVTGILRTTLMLGALIPFSINTMSIFSFSLSLAKAGNYVHPGYQMDDIICLIRWMGVTGRRLSIHMVPTAVISGPTCGRTVEIEFMEWARQARRWTIGAAEVFHYFMVKSRRIPFLTSFSWSLTFLIYYGILLCSSGLFGLTSLFSTLFILKNIPIEIIYINYGLLALQMFSFAIGFFIDIVIPRMLNIDECIFFLRNLFHFIMTPFVLIGYSFVEFYGLHEVLVRGKKVCKHGASNKAALN